MTLWDRRWMLGWRDITRASDIRTVIACIIPRAAVNRQVPADDAVFRPTSSWPAFTRTCRAYRSTIAQGRRLVVVSLKYFTMRQLPGLPTRRRTRSSVPWAPSIRMRDWLLPRVLELTYTAWNLEGIRRGLR